MSSMLRMTKSRTFAWTCVTVCVATPLLVAIFVPGYRPADFLARYFANQLDGIPDTEVPVHLQQIAELEMAGTPVLVRALNHRRATVAESAADALQYQMDQWARIHVSDSSVRVAHLAELLATQAKNRKTLGRTLAADLALRILNWPTEAETIDKPVLIARCQTIMDLAPQASPVKPAVFELESSTLPTRAVRAASNNTEPSGQLNLQSTDVIGGNLPVDEIQLPPLPPSLADSKPRPLRKENEPNLVPPTATRLPRVIFPDERVEEPESVLPSSPVPRQLAPELKNDPKLMEIDQRSAAVNQQSMEQESDLELMRYLHGSTQSDQQNAERELQRRGFGPAEIEMARHVADPDPMVRLELIKNLSLHPSPPGHWLFWLSYDPDPLVRRAVVSRMATAQDPRLHHRLREMQVLETDESVRALLDRMK